MEVNQHIQSLKLIIEQKKIKVSKLKEFHLVFNEIESFIEVSDTPSSASYKIMPTLVANDGSIFKFKEEDDETTSMLSSSSTPELSDTSILSETDNNISTLQTTQPEYILSSSQSILRSDDFI